MKAIRSRRLRALLLALVMLLSLIPVASAEGSVPQRGNPGENPFRDVQQGKYYYDAVLWACHHEPQITSGINDNTFGVRASCTRAQMATFLYAAAGKPDVEAGENPFKDVKEGKWYYDAVMWAVQNDITGGMTDDTFGVNATCTRAQAVTFLYAMAGRPEVQAEENPFADVPEGKWFYNAVMWAVQNGVTGGTSESTFSPNDKCTRAQIVTFLYAALGDYEGYVSQLDGEGRYVRGSDEALYDAAFREYGDLMEQARNAADKDSRFLLYAQAEAALLDTAAVLPSTTGGGQYAISHAAPHTTPFVRYGSDSQRLSRLVLSDELLTRGERSALQALWEAAAAGGAPYDPAAWLTGQGHALRTDYAAPCNGTPSTLDWARCSESSNNEAVLVNLAEGLVQFDGLGDLQPALAESWEVSPDGKTYTFHLRAGVYWYSAAGDPVAELTANDFVAGFRHMLDCRAGLEYLAGSGGAEILGVDNYLWGGGSFDDVGCKATDAHTLVYTLFKPCPFFLSMLTYSSFLPICDSFYRSRGGVYGIEAYDAALESGAMTYAQPEDVSSQVYCGPFLLQSLEPSVKVVCAKNPGYDRAEEVTLDTLTWNVDLGVFPMDAYEKTLSHVYAGVNLSAGSGVLDRAKSDGVFDAYAYVAETTATTYLEGLNLNRGVFALNNGACASPKTPQEQADAATALNNKSFRKALQHAFDKTSYNAVSRGEELAQTNLRNMITPPDFVKLEHEVVDAQGNRFPAGTFYGEMVQFYCAQRGCMVDCADGTDGWYKPEEARAYLRAAHYELGDSVTWPIRIDLVYYAAFESQTLQAQAYKQAIEETLGTDFVVVNLVAAETGGNYYASTYSAGSGEAANYDMFCGSGWAPDYGDPSACLNIFDRAVGGYMLKLVGLF